MECLADWRKVVAQNSGGRWTCALHGCSALSFLDGYTSGTLPANLIQAQRDYFGAHTMRADRPESEIFTRTGRGRAVRWPRAIQGLMAGIGKEMMQKVL